MPRIDMQAGSVRLSVFDEGTGIPILFVHGFPLSQDMWRGQFSLADEHRVIAPDLRGFGDSETVPGTTTMAQLADDCAALLDALGVAEPVVFCGLSMGGYVGWQFVRRHPQRLRALVLCDTRAAADTPEAAEGRMKMADHVRRHGTAAVAEAMLPKLFASETFQSRADVVAEIRSTIEQTTPDGLAAAQMGMAARDDARSLLPTIGVPTLVVVGRDDAISPVDEMRGIADAIPGARFHVIENAGHMSPLEQPAEFNRLLVDFVRET